MAEYPVLLHTAIDARDCRRLAEFYRELLGLHYREGRSRPPTAARTTPTEPLYVLADPAGHPFCLLVQ